MDKKLKRILDNIENLRRQMNELADVRSISDPEILKISQSLDILLVQYQKQMQRRHNRIKMKS